MNWEKAPEHPEPFTVNDGRHLAIAGGFTVNEGEGFREPRVVHGERGGGHSGASRGSW